MKKSLFLLPLLGILTLSSCTIVNILPGEPLPEPIPPKPDETVEDLTKFEGKVTIKGTEYTSTLTMDETAHTFEVTTVGGDYGEISGLSGKYSYEKGFGYTFFFYGSNTPLLSTYDAVTKTHSIKYMVKLGGEGNSGLCTLTMKDSKFEPITLTAKEAYVRNAVFDGYSMIPPKEEGGKPEIYLQRAKLNYDGTFKITGMSADEKTFIPEYDLDGTYTFENNTFTLKSGEKTYTSKFDLVTRDYAIELKPGSVLHYNPTIANPTFTGKNPDFMGFGFTTSLFMYADHTVFIDITTPMKSMNQMLDIHGTWAINEETGNREIAYTTRDQKGVTHDFNIPVTLKEGSKDVYEFEFQMVGSDGPTGTHLEGKFNDLFALKGTTTEPFPINYNLEFTGKDTALMSIPGPEKTLTDNFTYTFADNVITLTKGETSLTSTFDEAKGTYTVAGYEMPFGENLVLKPTLTYTLW